MSIKRIRFKPRGTMWVNVELFVSFGCEQAPEIRSLKIRGVKQFGLILSHEYDIDAFVDEVKRRACRTSRDCTSAVEYECDAKVFVSDVVGLGLGIGKLGTGTVGWPSESKEQTFTFTTDCICCDEPGGLQRTATYLPSTQSATAWFVAFSSLGAALSLSVLNWGAETLLPRLVVYGSIAGAAVSGVIAIARALMLRATGSSQSEEPPTNGPATDTMRESV